MYRKFSSFLNRPYVVRNRISTVFAPPRSGKTCLFTHLAMEYIKRGVKVYGNVELDLPDAYKKGYVKIEWSDVGKYLFKDCEVLIDEAGVDLNNRDFKNMKKETIKFLKYHGHFRCGMWYFSQSYDDMDITVRKLTTDYYIVGKTFLFPITKKIRLRRIGKHIDINDITHQIEDAYNFSFLSGYWFNAKKVFPYFNSYSTYYLPIHPNDIVEEDIEE